MSPANWSGGCGYNNPLEVLWQDSERIFCRTWRDGIRLWVLAVLPAAEHPTPASLQRLKHEYGLKDLLEAEWALRPRELVHAGQQTMLVLDFPDGEPLQRLVGAPMEVGRFLRVALALSRAVGRLHDRGLIHRDIKPTNILVNWATGQVWLTGFGIASRVPRERQSPEAPERIEGTLAYMAPEQTGRMNRSLDSRSDLYSLGVTLYEMITGSLPFTASDPMEWVHSHIARKPLPPNERIADVPPAVSAIIMKLLAKIAEERYRTASGLESDLQRCLAVWETEHRVDEFPLGEHDAPDRLLIPEKLYGRASEIDTLLASFDRVVASGMPELVLVSGYSGVGKSSVVHELHKALVPPRGLFASGKFDQYKRDIPYATIAQAFQSLVRSLLGKSEADLGNWREALRVALGPNGQLIVDLVPELKHILGEQPPVPVLAPLDAQRRFQLVLRRYIGVFARPEHPLALFLDDLQWLDAATLDLLEDLLSQPVRHLLLIGAYRDNEVDSAHPLMRRLDAIRKAAAAVHEIVLAPLAREDLQQLIVDSLRCEPQRAAPLASLVHEKTGGNPFFAIQFLTSLAEEGLLDFEHTQGQWSWDLRQIHAKGYTDNVVDLMVRKLSRLPLETQKALQLLACIGNHAELALLQMVSQQSSEAMQGHLSQALRAGLIFRSEDSYWFLHDRVQEATYYLIPEELRAGAHLRIGRLLTDEIPPAAREQKIFEIVNQLNRGAALISSRDECERLAEFNLMAGERAKGSTAYASALKYLVTGAGLLAEDSWEHRHEMALRLELGRAECEFLTGQLKFAQERLTSLALRAANPVELATIACLRMNVYTVRNQSDRAVAVCLDCLRHFGIEWMARPTDAEVRREYECIWSQLGSRSVEDLIQLPQMSDPASLATLDVLAEVLPSALFTDANLLSLAICRSVNLSLVRGNSSGSCVAYAWLGQIAGPHFGNYRAGFRFGRLGYELAEKRGVERFQARTYMVFACHVLPWTQHVRVGRDLIHRAFEIANRIGDVTFAAYSCINLNANLLAAGDPLPEVEREVRNGLVFAQKARFGFAIDAITVQLRLIRTLRGCTPKFGTFDNGQFEELQFEQHLAGDPALAQPECYYWIRKLQVRFLAGDHAGALGAKSRAQRLLWSMPSNLETADYHFYSALSHAASWDCASPEQKLEHLEAVAANNESLGIWAENCLDNFSSRVALVGGEVARMEGRTLDAEHLYEQAIRSAQANGFIHNEALANELAGRFYAARGLEKIAQMYLREARYCYVRWGADGKVRQLDQMYPHLEQEQPLTGPTSTISASVEHLDLATVIKLSQAISGEIVLEKLIDTLMRSAIEHAGAERGLLIVVRGDEYRIAAEATTGSDTVAVGPRQASATAADLPVSVLHYVVRTKASVLLHDASGENQFSADDYIRGRHARSILCLPLLKEARLVGVLYLENNLALHVFTPDRMVVLKLLAAQAAVSLENIRLYNELQEREQEARDTERRYLEAEVALAHANRLATVGQLSASVAHEVNQPIAAAVTNAHAALRWLDARPPHTEEVRQALGRIIKNGNRAGEVIGRIRALVKKAPPKRDSLQMNEAIREVIALTHGDVVRSGVSLQTQLAESLPLIQGDRVQLQQVVLNLMVNAIEAMRGVGDGLRELGISTTVARSGDVLVTVRDSGPELDAASLERVFEAFYTTKPGGLGIGLSICRSIIEAHGGRLWACVSAPRGAMFQFTLPVPLISQQQ